MASTAAVPSRPEAAPFGIADPPEEDRSIVDSALSDDVSRMEALAADLTLQWHALVDRAAALGCEIAKGPRSKQLDWSEIPQVDLDTPHFSPIQRLCHQHSNVREVVRTLECMVGSWSAMVDDYTAEEPAVATPRSPAVDALRLGPVTLKPRLSGADRAALGAMLDDAFLD